MKTILTTDHGPQLHQAARAVAAVLVAIYAAGYCVGEWLHQLNDHLAAALVKRPPVSPAALHPLASIAAEMEQLTVRELRAVTGIRRKMRKAELIATACCVL